MNYEGTNKTISPCKESDSTPPSPLGGRDWGWGKERRHKGPFKERKEIVNAAECLAFGVTDASSKPFYRIFVLPSNTQNMSETKKQEQDFTKEVDEILPTTTKLAQVSCIGDSESYIETHYSLKSGKLQQAVDELLVLEKQTRNVHFLDHLRDLH